MRRHTSAAGAPRRWPRLPWSRPADRRWARRHAFEVAAVIVVGFLAWLQPALALLVGLVALRVALDRAAQRALEARADQASGLRTTMMSE